MKNFQFDPRLTANSEFIIDWPLSTLRLKHQRSFPWCILIPRISNVSELFDLDAQQQVQLMQEMVALSQMMQQEFAPDKLNVGALGNQVSQFHVHVLARYRHDPLWPHGVWQEMQVRENFCPEQLNAHVQHLKARAASYFVDSVGITPDNVGLR